MSKKKKTLKQKIVADSRHSLYSFESLTEDKQISINNNPKPKIVVKDSIVSFTFLYHDLKKTAILSLLIIVAQVILFIFLKNGALKFLPLNY
jgi:hypothetical protein